MNIPINLWIKCKFKKRLAPVAQLDRVPGYEPGGRGFESCRARQFLSKQYRIFIWNQFRLLKN